MGHTFAIQISMVQYLSLVSNSFALNRLYDYCNRRVDKVNCTSLQFHFSAPFSVEGFWVIKDETSEYRLNSSIISACKDMWKTSSHALIWSIKSNSRNLNYIMKSSYARVSNKPNNKYRKVTTFHIGRKIAYSFLRVFYLSSMRLQIHQKKV